MTYSVCVSAFALRKDEQVVIDPDYYIRTYDFRENKLYA